MTRTRIRSVLALLALVALSAGLLACGGGDEESATQVLERASKTEVKSGNIDLRMSATLDGVEQLNGPVSLRMSGPFESHGEKELPSLDWKVSASGAGQSVDAGLIVLPDNAYVEFRGTTYEAGEALVKQLMAQARQNQDQQQTDLKKLGVDPTNWLADGKVEDGEEIGGAATDKVTGKLDIERMLLDFNKILEQPQFRSQLPPGASVQKISQENIDKVKEAVKDPTFTVNVAKDDDTIRRMAANVNFTVPEEEQQKLDGFKGGKFSFNMTMTDVGEKPNIEEPTGARPLTELLQSLGIPPEALQGAGALGQQGG